MSGTLKVGGKTLATHDTNTNVAKIQLGSTSDVVLTDSAGNNVLSESGGVVTLDSSVAFAKRLSNYQWNSWNPSDLAGTFTNSPSGGTTDDTDYTSMSNSNGTLTITFDVAGVYQVSLSSATGNSLNYSYQNIQMDFGGSAISRSIIMAPWGPNPSNGGQINVSQTFLVSATASQTLTILPKFRVSASGVTGNFTAYANCSVLYCGV